MMVAWLGVALHVYYYLLSAKVLYDSTSEHRCEMAGLPTA